jgi:hypothetical protein
MQFKPGDRVINTWPKSHYYNEVGEIKYRLTYMGDIPYYVVKWDRAPTSAVGYSGAILQLYNPKPDWTI